VRGHISQQAPDAREQERLAPRNKQLSGLEMGHRVTVEAVHLLCVPVAPELGEELVFFVSGAVPAAPLAGLEDLDSEAAEGGHLICLPSGNEARIKPELTRVVSFD